MRVDTINGVLFVFLGLFVFLLPLSALAVQFVCDARILKKLPIVVIAMAALVIPSRAPAQITPDPSSPAAPAPNEAPETAAAPAPSPEPDSERPVSWKLLYHNVIADQKQIWSFPARLVQGQNLAPTAAVLGTTAGLFLSIRSKRDISAARRHFMNSGTSLTATPRQSVWVRPRPRYMPSGGSARTRRCNTRRCSRVKPWPIPRSCRRF